MGQCELEQKLADTRYGARFSLGTMIASYSLTGIVAVMPAAFGVMSNYGIVDSSYIINITCMCATILFPLGFVDYLTTGIYKKEKSEISELEKELMSYKIIKPVKKAVTA